MIRLGLRLTLRSGREAIVRLIVTGAAVAAGVAILLGVLADFHAFELTANQPNWEGTAATPARRLIAARTELWNYSDEVYQGQTIERLDVAALGSDAPVPPGITKLPGPGQYYASPALRALIRSVPRGQLGARFPGSLAGTVGDRALTGPQELVVYVGVADTVQRLIDVAVALTLLVAGCSLAVTVGGGLVERKRPFTMLRLTGTSTATLYRVVLAEAVLPLVAATVVAAGLAYGMSVLTVSRIAPPGTPVPVLDHVYYLTMGTGLAVAVLVVLATLPLLGRITALDQVRFE
jgi:hypothetical protein